MRSVALALALAALGVSTVGAQVSPGPLAKAHAAFEGSLDCLKCHARGEGSLDLKCLECHQEIAWLIGAKRGLHAREGRVDCSRCHPDHAGRDFALIAWAAGEPERFDHDRAGFPLEGKHAAAKCRDCHRAKYHKGTSAILRKKKDVAASFVGLEPGCADCHDDVHRGALGSGCRTCHTLDAWKPATGFDHAKTAFPLAGRHTAVPCAKCHLAPGATAQVYKPLPHAACSDCHADVHKGQFGAKCASCHTAESWKKVDRAAFDHAKTRYPLLGRHAAVPCASCHDPKTAWGKMPAFSTCGACHRDAHGGKATLAGKAVDCASCHDVGGFSPSTYTVERHRATAYPLEGGHRKVRCGACHAKLPAGPAAASLGTSRIVLRPAHARCLDCHADAHAGQVAKRPHGGECASCHGVAGWKPATFGRTEHVKLPLPLEGRHAEVACAACHGPARRGLPALPGPAVLGKAGVALVSIPSECAACHFDPHGGRFAAKGERPAPGGCPSCHDSRAFRPSTVDPKAHARYAFPLEGAHMAIPCVACHAELKTPAPDVSFLAVSGTARRLSFTAKHARCSDCHATPHGAQFDARTDGGRCEACHDAEAFRPARRFDHVRDAVFTLDGAHRGVPCAKCHVSRPGPQGRAVVVYRPVAHHCEDCHRRPSAQVRGAS